MSDTQTLYTALGEEKIRILVNLFYNNVKSSPELRKLYEDDDLEGAENRLFLFLIYLFGGPATYLEERGHPMLRRRHFKWPIDGIMKDLWMQCMIQAIDSIAMEEGTKNTLLNYFVTAANHMVNKQ